MKKKYYAWMKVKWRYKVEIQSLKDKESCQQIEINELGNYNGSLKQELEKYLKLNDLKISLFTISKFF